MRLALFFESLSFFFFSDFKLFTSVNYIIYPLWVFVNSYDSIIPKIKYYIFRYVIKKNDIGFFNNIVVYFSIGIPDLFDAMIYFSN